MPILCWSKYPDFNLETNVKWIDTTLIIEKILNILCRKIRKNHYLNLIKFS